MGRYLSNDADYHIPHYFYYDNERILTNEDGDIVDNIYSLFNPNIIYLLRTKRDAMLVYDNRGCLVRLVYTYSYEYIWGDNDYPIDRIII